MISVMTKHQKLIKVCVLSLDGLLHCFQLLIIGNSLFLKPLEYNLICFLNAYSLIKFNHCFIKSILQYSYLLLLICRDCWLSLFRDAERLIFVFNAAQVFFFFKRFAF
jgi:hypothetical protein